MDERREQSVLPELWILTVMPMTLLSPRAKDDLLMPEYFMQLKKD